MPYEKVWREPEMVVEHAGVRVYRTYRDEDAELPDSVAMTTDPREGSGGSGGPHAFRLDLLAVDRSGTEHEVLRRAIDAGLVRTPEDPAGGDAPAGTWISFGLHGAADEEIGRIALALHEEGLGAILMSNRDGFFQPSLGMVEGVLLLNRVCGHLDVVGCPLPAGYPISAGVPALDRLLATFGSRANPVETLDHEPSPAESFALLCRWDRWRHALRFALTDGRLTVQDLPRVTGVSLSTVEGWLQGAATPMESARKGIEAAIEGEIRLLAR